MLEMLGKLGKLERRKTGVCDDYDDDGSDTLAWASENGTGAGAGLCVAVGLCPSWEVYFGCDAFCGVDGDETSQLRTR